MVYLLFFPVPPPSEVSAVAYRLNVQIQADVLAEFQHLSLSKVNRYMTEELKPAYWKNEKVKGLPGWNGITF